MNDDVQYVGFWARFIAFLIDSIVAGIIITPLVASLAGEIDLTQYNMSDPEDARRLLSLLSLRLSLDVLFLGTIFVMFWIFRSATPGKMLLGCSIVDARTLGKAGNLQNVIRYIAYFPGLFALGLGFLWIGFDARKQGWHDKMAGTVVIKGRPRDEPSPD